ncbi:MAG: insulinase family protein [Gammaproteobacteria bacterium]|nr:insulinase family protein [Gammaproteobacteria bacterium]
MKFPKYFSFFILCICVLSSQNLFAVNDKRIHEDMLSNGMKVLVKEDHRVPIVVSQVWYKVGSSYEPGGSTGMSHVLEHMMFKGTTENPDDSFNQIIARNGAEDNAFTSRDYTAYYQKLEASRLEISFQLEADRMRNLVFSKNDFDKEVAVVQEERRWRTDDKPQARAYEQLFVSAFENSGYHHPIIGWMDDLENLTLEETKVWYQKYYSPNNATLVVVGDVDPKAVFKLAEKHFGPIKADIVGPPKPIVERHQFGSKKIKMHLPAKVPYLIFGYKVPSLLTLTDDSKWEAYALELLAHVLDGGDSTRLPYNLVKKQQLAASVSSSYSSYARLQTLFMVDVTPAQSKTIDEVYQSLKHELNRVRTETVTVDELERVKNQIIAANVFEQDSIFYQAMKLGVAETTGLGWQINDHYIENIRKITPDQVLAVARKYLIEEQMTEVQVIPSEKLNQTKNKTN